MRMSGFVLLTVACSSANKEPEMLEIAVTDIVEGDSGFLGDEPVEEPEGDAGSDDGASDTGTDIDTGEEAGTDLDGDGFSEPEDCDDLNAAIYPDALEVCDGVDNDCDGGMDVDAVDAVAFYEDWDGDGFGDIHSSVMACEAPELYVEDATDCVDSDPNIYVGAPEYEWDSVDHDCDGEAEYELACVETGVMFVTSELDGVYSQSDGALLGASMVDQALVMSVGEYTLISTSSMAYRARVPVLVGLNTELDPFSLGDGCAGWVSAVEQEFTLDVELSLDGLWILSEDVVYTPSWADPERYDLHLVGSACPELTETETLASLWSEIASAYADVLMGIVGSVTTAVHEECSG